MPPDAPHEVLEPLRRDAGALLAVPLRLHPDRKHGPTVADTTDSDRDGQRAPTATVGALRP
ncbi:hypothetical protein GCM10010273_04330 [Streptomyces lavendulocolor]